MRHGFTLIELMIVIAIIAIIAAIAIPNLLESRVTANESNAAASLKSGVGLGAVQFTGSVNQDTDSDNVGEYGHIAHMAGLVACTGVSTLIDSANPAGALRHVQGPLAAIANRAESLKAANGYFYQVYTPDAAGNGMIAEVAGAQAAPSFGLADISPAGSSQNAEKYFCAVAVPQRYGDTGRRVFILSQEGQVRSPSAIANVNAWFTGGDAAANPIPTAASALTGMNDALTTDNDLSIGYATTYPFWSK